MLHKYFLLSPSFHIFAQSKQNIMKILVERKWKKEEYTIGKLYLDGTFFCNTLEDKDRGLTSDMPLEEIRKKKKAGITAIPLGTYNVRMDITSPKYSNKEWYVKNCHGAKMPRLENVPGYEGVLIHTGNKASETEGCLLVGKNDVKGMVTKSKECFLPLYNKMYAAYSKREKIVITIK